TTTHRSHLSQSRAEPDSSSEHLEHTSQHLQSGHRVLASHFPILSCDRSPGPCHPISRHLSHRTPRSSLVSLPPAPSPFVASLYHHRLAFLAFPHPANCSSTLVPRFILFSHFSH